MKIVDDKGRLFGKINLIDLSIILFLIYLIPMFYFGYRIFKKPPINHSSELVDIEVNAMFIKLKQNIVDMIKPGDTDMASDGLTTARIVWVGNSRPYQHRADIKSLQFFISDDPLLKTVPVKLKVKAEVRGDYLYYKNLRIAINDPIEFDSGKYKAVFIPEIIEGGAEKIQLLDLDVIFTDLDLDTIKLLAVGDKEIDLDKRVIAEIIQIGGVENESFSINLGEGNFITGKNSSAKQIPVKMRLLCILGNGGQIYFKGKMINASSGFEFITDKYKLLGMMNKGYKIVDTSAEEKWKEIKVKFNGIVPELANIIYEGDVAKDANGKVIGKIKKILRKTSSSALILDNGKFVNIMNPILVDMEAVLYLSCIQKNNVSYFNNNAIKIGNSIMFVSDIYNLTGMIIGIEGL